MSRPYKTWTNRGLAELRALADRRETIYTAAASLNRSVHSVEWAAMRYQIHLRKKPHAERWRLGLDNLRPLSPHSPLIPSDGAGTAERRRRWPFAERDQSL